MDRSRHRPQRDADPVLETRDRTRRIETRLTKLLIALGVDTESDKIVFDPGSLVGDAKVTIPSPHTSVKELLAAVPDTFDGAVDLFVGDQHLATLRKAPAR